MAQALTALQVVGAVAGGMQQHAQGMSMAAQQELQAKLEETKTLQRDTIAREELLRAESATRAARAANGLSDTSPSGMQLFEDRRKASDRDRLVERADGKQRAANFRTAARSSRTKAKWSLATGFVRGGIPLAQYGHYQGWGS